MRDFRERRDDRAEPARRQHQRIPAAENDLPDLGMGADKVECPGELGGRERAPSPDHLATEAETAIDRTDMQRLEQDAIGIAMHDALDRAMGVVADRVGDLLRPRRKLGRMRQILPGNRIARISGIDQLGDVGGERQRVAGGDVLELGATPLRRQSGCDQVGGSAQRPAD